MLYVIAAGGLVAALLSTPASAFETLGGVLAVADIVTAGLLLGSLLTAMLLGHWYLNSPGMQLAPLRRLLVLLISAVGLRMGVAAAGLLLTSLGPETRSNSFWLMVGFRWLAGLCGVGATGWMAWQTLKVPNTQSATGILYAGVILAFLGELVSSLLSVDANHPM